MDTVFPDVEKIGMLLRELRDFCCVVNHVAIWEELFDPFIAFCARDRLIFKCANHNSQLVARCLCKVEKEKVTVGWGHEFAKNQTVTNFFMFNAIYHTQVVLCMESHVLSFLGTVREMHRYALYKGGKVFFQHIG